MPHVLRLFRGISLILCAFLVLGQAPGAGAQETLSFLRIGTGSVGGTYFPIGGIIANAVSKPPGSRECVVGGSCGVPGLIAVAQSTAGSVDNVRGIASNTLDSGFVQADVAFLAYNGKIDLGESGKTNRLRSIASLFPEAVHLVVRRNSGIRSVKDLKGKRISLDREGSGTQVDALAIIDAFGLSPEDLQVESLPADDAADQLMAGNLDGFFMVAGAPAVVIESLAFQSLVDLVPITGPEIDALQESHPFFTPARIQAGIYFNVPRTETIAVNAQWLVSADLAPETVYGITRALWHPNTRKLLESGHPKGREILIENALDGLVVPLHPGARRYYSERGLAFH